MLCGKVFIGKLEADYAGLNVFDERWNFRDRRILNGERYIPNRDVLFLQVFAESRNIKSNNILINNWAFVETKVNRRYFFLCVNRIAFDVYTINGRNFRLRQYRYLRNNCKECSKKSKF